MHLNTTELARCAQDFAEARTTCRAAPTRFYLNLTERCNLRCQHCITRAPERTMSRQARDFSPEVLAALRPHFRAATYLGFPHAGEPLLAPLLEPTLRALQEERAGEPSQVHLLTNTQALTLERFTQLVDLGVSSWSFSLDGMSATTNDWLRQGGNIERSLQLLQQCAQWRSNNAADVRMGVAYTLHRDNLGEVTSMIRFVHDAGLDWLKLEEMYPVNSLSHELAQIDATQLQTVLAEAVALAASRGVKLLLHLEDLDARRCQCDANAQISRFCELDSYANRMFIHACRLPWELVCIEPNGDVKPLSFHHPVAGNVLEQDLLQIWNSTNFIAVREQVLTRCCFLPRPRPCLAPDLGPTSW